MSFKIVSTLVLIVAMLGFVLPYLFSADNTELVLFGIFLSIASCYVVAKQAYDYLQGK